MDTNVIKREPSTAFKMTTVTFSSERCTEIENLLTEVDQLLAANEGREDTVDKYVQNHQDIWNLYSNLSRVRSLDPPLP
ncbi:hypothetical protein PROFUN_11285 [Planoprotostelium fungivorum]|uniref:Uncharacterized protein n=1 Tax=Planoprotostelium fungivorum TaxID=1890364 RepID=A0A2P6NAH8_9EUKA|nr:hypothetical protein PROFUN_11285 [Planoprotostelium fungivorum]